MGKLDGKIALITGGSDGIGLATAQQFLKEGADHVFITGRRQNVLDAAIKKINKKNITAVQGDVCDMADLDRLYALIKKEKGRLDILFANAGMFIATPIHLVTEKNFDSIFNINVKGVVFTVQKALPIFVDGGSIILNGSIGSIKGFPNTSIYNASKAAVRSFARCWTSDLKQRRIRVNTVSPGSIDTSMLRQAASTEQEQETYLEQCGAATVMNRIGMPDEVAKTVVFLASDDSSYITGIELFVDGGAGQI